MFDRSFYKVAGAPQIRQFYTRTFMLSQKTDTPRVYHALKPVPNNPSYARRNTWAANWIFSNLVTYYCISISPGKRNRIFDLRRQFQEQLAVTEHKDTVKPVSCAYMW